MESKIIRICSILNNAAAKRLALEVMHKKGRTQFRRVSDQFTDRLEANVIAWVRSEINHPTEDPPLPEKIVLCGIVNGAAVNRRAADIMHDKGVKRFTHVTPEFLYRIEARVISWIHSQMHSHAARGVTIT